ncbi:MAG: hypothetical protein WA081_05355 [Desulfosalsimonadaceae bacterium]
MNLDYYTAICTFHITGRTGFVNRNSPAPVGNAWGHALPPTKDMFAIYR